MGIEATGHDEDEVQMRVARNAGSGGVCGVGRYVTVEERQHDQG